MYPANKIKRFFHTHSLYNKQTVFMV